MPSLDANLQFMFNEYDVLDRYDAAARAGFKAVELQSPYPFEPEQVKERLERNGLRQILINMPAGDERNVPIRPDRRDQFREFVAQGVKYAEALNCPVINCPPGPAPEGAPADELKATLVENLRYAATEFAKVGTRVLVEAINTRDQPGFFVHTTSDCRAVIQEAAHENLGIQYDVYHMQIMEGDLARTIQANLDLIGHIQIADTPGRNEPGTGEINYDFLLPYIDSLGYEGWVGCEYKPAGRTEDGLGWAGKYL
ncbi:MAG: TIM barrel protein [Dehalococcoidia bacterium]